MKISAVEKRSERRRRNSEQAREQFPAKILGGASVLASRLVSSLAPPRKLHREALGEVDLIDVASADVALSAFDSGEEVGACD